MGLWVIAFFLLVLAGLPISFALGIVPSFIIVTQDKAPITILPQSMFSGLDSFTVLAVPLFVLAGELMASSGMSERLVAFANLLTGRIRGGFGMATVVASTLFGGVSGSATADTAAVGAITIPGMMKSGYSRGFATSLQAAAGPIGVLIPPSIPMIMYGVVTNTSITQLFIGGIIPGLLMCLGFMLCCFIYASTSGKDTVVSGFETDKSVGKIVLDALPALGLPVIIVGGVRMGVVTPTEGAVLAVLYALFVGIVIYRELTFSKIKEAFISSGITTAVVMWILANAFIFSWLLTAENLPNKIVGMLGPFINNKLLLLLFINILFIIVGTFLETIAVIIMLAPVILPVAAAAGITPLGLGIIMVTNLAIGMYTPPVGVTLFVASGISGARLSEVVKSLLPILLVTLIVLAIVTLGSNQIVQLVKIMMGF